MPIVMEVVMEVAMALATVLSTAISTTVTKVVAIALASSVGASILIAVATAVATWCGFMYRWVCSCSVREREGVVVLREGGWRVDGMQGVPPGGVGDIGLLPGRFPRWEEEQPKLIGGGMDHHTQD